MKLLLAATILFSGLILFIGYQKKLIEKKEAQIEKFITNEKSLNQGLKVWTDKYNNEYTQTIQQKKTIQELKDEMVDKDSKIQALVKKGKDIREVVHVVQKTDTVIIRQVLPPTKDSIVIDFSDEYMLAKVYIDSTQRLELKMENDLVTLFKERKEVLGTPSKLFFIRWFQKKHLIIDVTTVTSNPYMRVKEQTATHIVK